MRSVRSRATLVALAALAGSIVWTSAGNATTPSPGAITGITFEDVDRDGVPDQGEPRLSGHLLYLFDAAGSYLGNTRSADDGTYGFPVVAGGNYSVRYASDAWWALRRELVPTTTASLHPDQTVVVNGDVTADFGWRRLVWSNDPAEPLDAYIGPDGLEVRTYVDAVPASEIYDAAHRGTVGEEAPTVLIRFGYAGASSTTSSVVLSGGTYGSYSATVDLDYVSWLDSADRNLGHEYGHAWSMYHAYITQQDATLASYLEARGISDDPRVGSSYLWSPGELIAEDYRQLLGSPTAATAPQANRDLPPAEDVPGLEAFLRDHLTAAPEIEPAPEPSPDPSSTPEPEPTDVQAPRGKKGDAVKPGNGRGKNKG